VPRLESFRLEVFRTVAENASFRKAGRRTLSQATTRNSADQGTGRRSGRPAIRSRGTRVELTSPGSMLLRYVRQVDRLLGRAEQEIAALNRTEGGELCLGVSTTISQYVLPRVLKEFRKEHPKIRLSAQSGNTEHIVEALIGQKVSLGLIEGRARRRDVRSCQDLIGAPLLMRERGSGSHRNNWRF
jgi:LysR family transcriptional regulator, transcriptional activator of the cysJI operon